MYKKLAVIILPALLLLTPVPAFAFIDGLLHLAVPLAAAPFAGKQKKLYWCPFELDTKVYKTKQANIGYFYGIDGKKFCRLK